MYTDIEEANKIITALEKEKNSAYRERNSLVAFLSKQFPSHLTKHIDDGTPWDEDWLNVVCVHTPAGDLQWHIHRSELTKFRHLEKTVENHWDGSTRAEKYSSLADLGDVRIEG